MIQMRRRFLGAVGAAFAGITGVLSGKASAIGRSTPPVCVVGPEPRWHAPASEPLDDRKPVSNGEPEGWSYQYLITNEGESGEWASCGPLDDRLSSMHTYVNYRQNMQAEGGGAISFQRRRVGPWETDIPTAEVPAGAKCLDHADSGQNFQAFLDVREFRKAKIKAVMDRVETRPVTEADIAEMLSDSPIRHA